MVMLWTQQEAQAAGAPHPGTSNLVFAPRRPSHRRAQGRASASFRPHPFVKREHDYPSHGHCACDTEYEERRHDVVGVVFVEEGGENTARAKEDYP